MRLSVTSKIAAATGAGIALVAVGVALAGSNHHASQTVVIRQDAATSSVATSAAATSEAAAATTAVTSSSPVTAPAAQQAPVQQQPVAGSGQLQQPATPDITIADTSSPVPRLVDPMPLPTSPTQTAGATPAKSLQPSDWRPSPSPSPTS